jgi:hypothetical protein
LTFTRYFVVISEIGLAAISLYSIFFNLGSCFEAAPNNDQYRRTSALSKVLLAIVTTTETLVSEKTDADRMAHYPSPEPSSDSEESKPEA